MRIIAGKFKGKVLSSFELDSTRPTSDIVREALFNILYNVSNKTFLDLFGGTGAVCLEAISRGVKQAVVVDNNKLAISLINKNVKSCNADNVKVLFLDYLKALKKLEEENYCFDIIFLDPPYSTNYAEQSLNYLKNSNLINNESIIIWEHDKTKLNIILERFEIVNQKRYGSKYLTILTKV